MALTPIGKRFLASRIPIKETHGRIILPQSAQEDNGPKLYRVLKRGPKVDPEISDGDVVLCHAYDTGPADLPDGNRIISDDQVLMIIGRESV